MEKAEISQIAQYLTNLDAAIAAEKSARGKLLRGINVGFFGIFIIKYNPHYYAENGVF